MSKKPVEPTMKELEEKILNLQKYIAKLEGDIKVLKEEECPECLVSQEKIEELLNDIKVLESAEPISISFVKKGQAPKKGHKFVSGPNGKLIEVKESDPKYA